jgi:hypothetical protein
MRTILPALLLFVSIWCSAKEMSETDLFGVQIGQRAPDRIVEGRSTSSAFLLVAVPLKTKALQEALHNVNVFIFPKNKIVAGLRSDRVFSTRDECDKAKLTIESELRNAYPKTYSGPDRRYQFESKDGKVVAGVICENTTPFPRLALEVTNPQLEAELMSTFRAPR